MKDKKTSEKINHLLAEYADFWSISDLQINYFQESIYLSLLSLKGQEIVKTSIEFKEVMSFYYFQGIFPGTTSCRLNEFKNTDLLLLSEVLYLPEGYGQINIKSLDLELKEIESISSKTNFYFQISNKDAFFIEANSININDESFTDLIADSNVLKNPFD